LGALFERRGFVSGLQFLYASDRFTCLQANAQSHKRIARLLLLLQGYVGQERAAVYGRLTVVELLILELQKMIDEMQDDFSFCENVEAGQSQLIKGVIGYINESYMEDIHLDTIAKKFWVNPSYLSRKFKEKLGLNISHYIMERRVYMAQKLLLLTDLRIAEISQRIGYKDAAYFNAVFKKKVGVSPGEYRIRKKI
jgi:YesN/AraC family two-component response regulator